MEFVNGTTFFDKAENKIKEYGYLNKNITTDILIVGGGICGAILNNKLSQNYDVVLIEKNRLCKCNTACATALLEYQLDSLSNELYNQLTYEEIVSIYRMGLKSIEKIAKFVEENGNNCHFSKRPTLMFSNKKADVKKFVEEYNFRKTNKFDCELITNQNNKFPFDIEIGIFAENGGCEFNPYLFAKQMIDCSKNQKNIYENTKYINHNLCSDGAHKYVVTCSYGHKIYCNKLIFSTGYDFEPFQNQSLFKRYSTYSIVTNKLSDFDIYKNTLIHDFKKPYHYLRLLPDNRIIFGGEDMAFGIFQKKQKNAQQKYSKLYKDLIKLFPSLENKAEIEYSFMGGFGETDNNVGLIGKTNEDDVFLFLSCGANGIINAMFGADLVCDLLENKENSLEHIFSPLRIINS